MNELWEQILNSLSWYRFFSCMSYICLDIVPKTKLLYDFRRLEIECIDQLNGGYFVIFGTWAKVIKNYCCLDECEVSSEYLQCST